MGNNLAILRTKENFLYQEHVGPACLPRPDESFEGKKGENCFSSGWGADSFGTEAAYHDELQKIQLPVVGRRECQKRMENTARFKGKGFRLHDSWMCIGGVEGKDTCKGDGGSPHVCKTDEGWTQVGAVAWGVECGAAVPTIYSSIPNAMCWIDWVMSCFGESTENINGLFADEFDFRGDSNTPGSINSLAGKDCQRWMEGHSD